MEWSIFDVIGPIMIGPSSSHTAGAANLGFFANLLSGGNPKKLTINLFGSFAKVYKGHGTDWALLGGLLGMRSDDMNLTHAMRLAEQKKIVVEFKYDVSARVNHPNTVEFEIVDKYNHLITIRGASIGGGSIIIDRINNLEIPDINGRDEKIVVIGEDYQNMADVLQQMGLSNRKNNLIQNQKNGFVLILDGDAQDYKKLKPYVPNTAIISLLPKLS